jgi:hypothetical protein
VADRCHPNRVLRCGAPDQLTAFHRRHLHATRLHLLGSTSGPGDRFFPPLLQPGPVNCCDLHHTATCRASPWSVRFAEPEQSIATYRADMRVVGRRIVLGPSGSNIGILPGTPHQGGPARTVPHIVPGSDVRDLVRDRLPDMPVNRRVCRSIFGVDHDKVAIRVRPCRVTPEPV